MQCLRAFDGVAVESTVHHTAAKMLASLRNSLVDQDARFWKSVLGSEHKANAAAETKDMLSSPFSAWFASDLGLRSAALVHVPLAVRARFVAPIAALFAVDPTVPRADVARLLERLALLTVCTGDTKIATLSSGIALALLEQGGAPLSNGSRVVCLSAVDSGFGALSDDDVRRVLASSLRMLDSADSDDAGSGDADRALYALVHKAAHSRSDWRTLCLRLIGASLPRLGADGVQQVLCDSGWRAAVVSLDALASELVRDLCAEIESGLPLPLLMAYASAASDAAALASCDSAPLQQASVSLLRVLDQFRMSRAGVLRAFLRFVFEATPQSAALHVANRVIDIWAGKLGAALPESVYGGNDGELAQLLPRLQFGDSMSAQRAAFGGMNRLYTHTPHTPHNNNSLFCLFVLLTIFHKATMSFLSDQLQPATNAVPSIELLIVALRMVQCVLDHAIRRFWYNRIVARAQSEADSSDSNDNASHQSDAECDVNDLDEAEAKCVQQVQRDGTVARSLSLLGSALSALCRRLQTSEHDENAKQSDLIDQR